MFQEVPFEESNETREMGKIRSNGSSACGSASSANTIVRFHKPGDPDFSAVAGATSEVDVAFNPRLFNGDSWLSSDCHCIKCEGIRLIEKSCTLCEPKREISMPPITSLHFSSKSSDGLPVLILLDLDNFGFRQFQLMPPRLFGHSSSAHTKSEKRCELSNDELFSYIFVWGFFGSCFTRYHKLWPTEDLLLNMDNPLLTKKQENSCEKRSGSLDASHNSPVIPSSIWKRLVLQKRLLLTPCSGGCQGADGVLRQVVNVFSPSFDIVVVSGDGPLIQLLQEDHRRGSRKRKRTGEMSRNGASNPDVFLEDKEVGCGRPTQIRFIHIPPKEKKLVPVWNAIAVEVSSLRCPRGKNKRK